MSVNLPRNIRSKNALSHRKKDFGQEAERSRKKLNSICEKHKIGILTFKSCKFASKEGKVSFVEHEIVKGNMKSGIIIIKIISISPSDNAFYDIVNIVNNKNERDDKKQKEEMEKAKLEIEQSKLEMEKAKLETEQSKLEMEKAKLEMENLNQNSVLKPSSETSEHQDLLDKIDSEINNSLGDINVDISTSDNLKLTDINCNETMEIKCNESTKQNNGARRKREKAIKQMQLELSKKANDKEGNKYYRNFMSDIKNKFSLEEKPEFYYFEVKVNVTEMVISDARVYKLLMSSNAKEIYMLIIGDLQMKTSLIRNIDPMYKSENFIRDQDDFLERIKAAENLKTTETSENLSNESDKSSDTDTDIVESDRIPNLEIIDKFLSPELLELKNTEII